MTYTSIINLVIDSVNQHLLEVLQTDLETSDTTRANTVRLGAFQADPTVGTGITVMTYCNDPDSDEWEHECYDYELGGPEMWWRRFTVKISQFYGQNVKDRMEGNALASSVLTRTEAALSRWRPNGVGPDSEGEVPVELQVKYSRNKAGGAPGSFIYRGVIFFQVRTDKNIYHIS